MTTDRRRQPDDNDRACLDYLEESESKNADARGISLLSVNL
jgi:hypothetical protein